MGFSKISKPTEQGGAYYLQFNFPLLFSVAERLENWKLKQMVRKLPPFRSERKKRTWVLTIKQKNSEISVQSQMEE